jgi:hypothetical protein
VIARGPENACRETIGTNSKRGVVKIKRSLRLSLRHVKYKFDNELKTLRDSPGVTATGTGQYSTHDFYFVLVALQWTLRFFDELSKLERHVWDTFVDGDRTTIALGAKGVIVPGCEACRKRIGTNSQYLRHLADDMLPAIFSGCAQRRELSAALASRHLPCCVASNPARFTLISSIWL